MHPAGDDHKLLVLDVEDGVGAGDRQDWHVVACQCLMENILFSKKDPFSYMKLNCETQLLTDQKLSSSIFPCCCSFVRPDR